MSQMSDFLEYLSSQPSKPFFNPKEKVGKHFTLGDLIKTGYNVNNTPNNTNMIDTLRSSGPILDWIYDNIGPFKIVSGYRSSALQSALRGGGLPTSSGKSFHELGLAYDIVPTTMNLEKFWEKMIASSYLRKALGEVALKAPQGSIHFSIGTSWKPFTPLKMNSAKQYIRVASDEVQRIIKENPVGVGFAGLAFIGIIGVGIYFYTTRGK